MAFFNQSNPRICSLLPAPLSALALLALLLPSLVAAGDEPTALASAAADPHAHHRHMMQSANYERSVHSYQLPDRVLVDNNGQEMSLAQQLDAEKPVMLNFIFTTCTTICPVLSASFYQVRLELGEEKQQLQMISITIDPEYDTPERLQTYAERYKADAGWKFLTGEFEDIVAVQKAFDAYRGSKSNHEPLTFIRAPGADSWVRLEGLASASDIVQEYHGLVAE